MCQPRNHLSTCVDADFGLLYGCARHNFHRCNFPHHKRESRRDDHLCQHHRQSCCRRWTLPDSSGSRDCPEPTRGSAAAQARRIQVRRRGRGTRYAVRRSRSGSRRDCSRSCARSRSPGAAGTATGSTGTATDRSARTPGAPTGTGGTRGRARPCSTSTHRCAGGGSGRRPVRQGCTDRIPGRWPGGRHADTARSGRRLIHPSGPTKEAPGPRAPRPVCGAARAWGSAVVALPDSRIGYS